MTNPSYTRAIKRWAGVKLGRGGTALKHPIKSTRSAKKFLRMRRVRSTWPSAVNRPAYGKLRKRFGIP